MSDASLGVTNPGYRPGDTATALPAGIALGASFNPALARQSGGMLGREARSRGFNVQLAGGINLVRDPRNGRNFEYLSEDPLLSAALAAESINGIQGEGVISTIKHYSLNCNETNRHWLDAIIDPAAHRESDLLAFEIAIERAQPGSVMTGYNKINGDYAGGNGVLIQGVLKGAWGYLGWVMSDWGGTPGWEAALRGLDQESGLQLDMMMWQKEWFTARCSRPTRKARCRRSACLTWCGASCARCSRSASRGGDRHPRSTWRNTTRSLWIRPARASCCSRTMAPCPWPPTPRRGSQ
jgi:beta-glucosidase